MGSIRVLAHQDLAGTALLHRRVFGRGGSDPQDVRQRERYLRRVFLESQDHLHGVMSLVYEEEGTIIGFLGVVPRHMLFMGKPVLAAVTSQFIVDPERRSSMAGIRLLKQYFKGPQDLSIADEANSSARTLWEAFGGRTAMLYSLYWTRPLRPGQYALSLLRGRKGWALWAGAARPVARMLDAMAARLPGSPLRPPPSGAVGEDVSDERLWSYVPEFCAGETLRPEYPLSAWKWMLQRAQDRRECGTFHRIAVQSDRKETLGWYLYYLKRGGISEVLQMAAKPNCGEAVWSHLLHHAWLGGTAAVSGRLQPGWLPVLSENREQRCLFHRGPWVLVRAKEPDLAHAFCQGKAFLSRLEGEWCLRYQ